MPEETWDVLISVDGAHVGAVLVLMNRRTEFRSLVMKPVIASCTSSTSVRLRRHQMMTNRHRVLPRNAVT